MSFGGITGEADSVIRVVVTDDQSLIRVGLRSVLTREPGVEVVGEAADGAQAVEFCQRQKPDLVLMDIEMPRMDGIAATRQIKEVSPRTSVLVLTSHDDPECLLSAIGAGAAGYLLKEHAVEHVADAVRRVVNGESPLDEELAMRLLRRVSEEHDSEGARKLSNRPDADRTEPEKGASGSPEGDPPKSAVALTDREREVLALIARGRTNREIASELYVGIGTVKTHVHRIIAKLGVSDRTQAAVLAIRLGLADGR